MVLPDANDLPPHECSALPTFAKVTTPSAWCDVDSRFANRTFCGLICIKTGLFFDFVRKLKVNESLKKFLDGKS